MTTARSWVIELPPGTPILTANDRLNRYAANRQVRDLKRLMITLTALHRVPPVDGAVIVVEYQPPPRLKKHRHPLASARIEDNDNLAPTAKALVDGLVKAGVLVGDSRKRVTSSTRLLADTHPRGQVRVHITEAAPGRLRRPE